MEEIRRELKRLRRTIDMMLTMHCILRDRYKRRALLMDLVLLIASFLLLVLNFTDEAFLDWIGIYPIEALQNGKILAVVIFIVSLFTLRVDWKQKVARYERACQILSRLKGETRTVALDENLCPERFKEYQQLCSITMSSLCPVPEKQFHKLKAKHLRKIELSKMISSYPGCPIWILRIGLFIKGFYNACRRKEGGNEN